MRDKDKVKEDDALAYLSDQLLVLSKRIYTTVRKQNYIITWNMYYSIYILGLNLSVYSYTQIIIQQDTCQ